MLTATDQKPQKSLKRWYYPPSHCLNVNVMLSKKGINKKNSLYFTHLPRSPPSTDLHEIWRSRRGRRHNHLYQFFGDRSRGVYSVGVENCHLPLTKPVAVNTGLALPRSPWCAVQMHSVTKIYISTEPVLQRECVARRYDANFRGAIIFGGSWASFSTWSGRHSTPFSQQCRNDASRRAFHAVILH